MQINQSLTETKVSYIIQVEPYLLMTKVSPPQLRYVTRTHVVT